MRLTGSMYRADKAMSNTLYGGDRAGSRYYWVMENTAATESAQFTSGLINPGFMNKVTDGSGRAHLQAVRGGHGVPLPAQREAVRGRPLCKAYGELPGITGDAGANRWQIGGGWFRGVMLEGVVAF